jgi:5-methyltetrahydropteroyltriglutamate--homocysteine methyltransferase
MEARQRRDDGEITDDDLRIIEDEHIIGVIERQEKVGLQGDTDGEFRRLFFHVDFLEHLDGVEVTYGDFFAYLQKDD